MVLDDFRSSSRQAIFGFSVLMILWWWVQGMMLHQLAAPPLVYPNADNSFWLITGLGLPQLLSGHFGIGLVFSVLLLVTHLLACLRKELLWTWGSFVLMSLYFMVSKVYQVQPSLYILPLWLAAIPFLFARSDRFVLAWMGMRYYILFIFWSAALWKIFRGNLSDMNHMSDVLMVQHMAGFLTAGSAWKGSLMDLAATKPMLVQALLYLGLGLQLIFGLGWISSKNDKLLILVLGLFLLGNLVFMDLFFPAMLVFFLFLYPWRSLRLQWAKY